MPELLFKNLGEQPVLLVEGEELVGATFAGLDLFAHEATRRPGRSSREAIAAPASAARAACGGPDGRPYHMNLVCELNLLLRLNVSKFASSPASDAVRRFLVAG